MVSDKSDDDQVNLPKINPKVKADSESDKVSFFGKEDEQSNITDMENNKSFNFGDNNSHFGESNLYESNMIITDNGPKGEISDSKSSSKKSGAARSKNIFDYSCAVTTIVEIGMICDEINEEQIDEEVDRITPAPDNL